MAQEDVAWRTEFYADFIVMGEIGRGRFAVVKQVMSEKFGGAFAVKEINKMEQSREAVELEFRLMRQLKDPGIPEALFLYESPQDYLMVLVWVPGPSVCDFLIELDEFTENTVKNLIFQFLKILAHIHSKFIAHLDLKPENLMVKIEMDAGPRLILIDFGDARLIHPQAEPPFVTTHQGSVEFTAPEQLNASALTLRTDIW